MAADSQSPEERFEQLRPGALLAMRDLTASLESDGSVQHLLDLYVYSKRVVAEVMEARLDMELSEPCPEFDELRDTILTEMKARYQGVVPEQYLFVPYGSPTYQKLFRILIQRLGEPVPAELLRVPTRDSVHTERRVRELRELGLEINTTNSKLGDTYCLESLDLDLTLVPRIIYNNARTKKHPKMEESELRLVLTLD